MKIYAAVALSVCALFVTNCEKKSKVKPDACGGLGVMNNANPVIRDRLKIERPIYVKQVKHCPTGKVVTTRTTGSDPKNSFQLKAQTLRGGSLKGFMLSVFNRSTCEFGDYKGNHIKPEPAFMVKAHTSRGTSRMRVLKNRDNFMDYEIRECVQRDLNDRNKCLKSAVAERGTVVLFIDYSEPDVVLSGIEDNCNPAGQPKP